MNNLRLIKRTTLNKIKKDFDSEYDKARKIALEKYYYEGEIKVISDNKYVNFYMFITTEDYQ